MSGELAQPATSDESKSDKQKRVFSSFSWYLNKPSNPAYRDKPSDESRISSSRLSNLIARAKRLESEE